MTVAEIGRSAPTEVHPQPLVVYVTPEFPEGRVAFSVAESARLLGVGEHAVRKAIENGQLHATRFNDRGLVVPAWAIDEFLARRDRAGALDVTAPEAQAEMRDRLDRLEAELDGWKTDVIDVRSRLFKLLRELG